MKPTKWAVTLHCDEQAKLEPRIARIVEYLARDSEPLQWVVSDIDATGSSGNSLTWRLNDQGTLYLSTSEFLDVLNEDGQILELNATFKKDDQELFKILVRDGISIDVLGSDELLPSKVLGKYVPVDIALFL